LLAFFIGGALFTLARPIIAMLTVVLVISLFLLMLVPPLIPGGWLLGCLGIRSLFSIMHNRIAKTLILSIVASLLVPIVGRALGDSWNSLLLFFTGGVLGTLTVARTRTAYQPSRQGELARQRPSGPLLLPLRNSGPFSRERLTSSDLRGGTQARELPPRRDQNSC